MKFQITFGAFIKNSKIKKMGNQNKPIMNETLICKECFDNTKHIFEKFGFELTESERGYNVKKPSDKWSAEFIENPIGYDVLIWLKGDVPTFKLSYSYDKYHPDKGYFECGEIKEKSIKYWLEEIKNKEETRKRGVDNVNAVFDYSQSSLPTDIKKTDTKEECMEKMRNILLCDKLEKYKLK